MIKEIKVILEKQIPMGGFKFIVEEMVPNPPGFPIENPIKGDTVTIFDDVQQVLQSWTDENGTYFEPKLPVGSYTWKVEFAGYDTKQGTVTVEV